MSQHKTDAGKAYWRANLRLMGILLTIWFVVSFGFGILLRPVLDQVSIGGAPLGFWFAQQGSIFVFVILIFYYAHAMDRLEKRFGAGGDGEGDADKSETDS
jgi:putative solute:sodium symporter small subunit